MRDGAFIGIDLGTSGARAAALDSTGRLVALARREMDPEDARRRDPSEWLLVVEAALSEVLQRLGDCRIEAVSVDATSGTVLAVDSRGEPIGAALMYNDAVDRPDAVRAISDAAPRESAAHGAASALARAIVLQERPGATRILHQADWIAERLAGHPVPSDESNALKTGYDPVERRWPDWLSATPLDPVSSAGGCSLGHTDRTVLRQLRVAAGCSRRCRLHRWLRLVLGDRRPRPRGGGHGARLLHDAETALGPARLLPGLRHLQPSHRRFLACRRSLEFRWSSAGAVLCTGGYCRAQHTDRPGNGQRARLHCPAATRREVSHLESRAFTAGRTPTR